MPAVCARANADAALPPSDVHRTSAARRHLVGAHVKNAPWRAFNISVNRPEMSAFAVIDAAFCPQFTLH
jgi:hypothetical protein